MTGIKVSVLFEKLLDRALRLRKTTLIEINGGDAKLGVERRWLELERFLIRLDRFAQPCRSAVVPLVHRRVSFCESGVSRCKLRIDRDRSFKHLDRAIGISLAFQIEKLATAHVEIISAQVVRRLLRQQFSLGFR